MRNTINGFESSPVHRSARLHDMHAIEFTTERDLEPVLKFPANVAAQLHKSDTARIIVLTGDDAEDGEWRQGSYEQFLKEDPPEDSGYDSYR